jgi:ankyrin repeat protein
VVSSKAANAKEVVRLLVTGGAKINAKVASGFFEGRTPLDMAYLLRKNDIIIVMRKLGGKTADEIGAATSIHSSVRIGDYNLIKRHLNTGVDINSKEKKRGETPLHAAVRLAAFRTGDEKMIEFLIGKGAEVNSQSRSGETPLDIVTEGINSFNKKHAYKIVKLLQQYGGEYGKIQSAASSGDVNIVKKFLTSGVDVNEKGKFGVTALINSAQQGHKEVVELLIAKGADVNMTGNGVTALNAAARLGHKEVVELLIAKGADVNLKGNNGWPPIARAAQWGRGQIIELLIANGANVNALITSSRNYKGKSTLDVAIESKKRKLVPILRNHGAKTSEELQAEGKISDPKQPEPAKEDKKLWAKSYLSQKAPELIVEKWLSEKPEWKGKFLLVDFWATWCGPCLKAIPELNRFHEQFGKQMVVVGLSDEQESKVASMKQPQIEYYSAIDTQKRMKNEVKVTGIPHVMIIDPQGIVRWEGFPFLSGHELTEEVVDNLLRKHGGKTGEELKAAGN